MSVKTKTKTVATKPQGPAVSKFFSNLTAGHEGIKEKRANQLTTAAHLAQDALLNRLRNEVNGLETELDKLTDLHPVNSTDLTVGGENFNAEEWVNKVQSTKVALLNKQVELKLAVETHTEWFAV